MHRIYLLAKKPEFPEPQDELHALAKLEAAGKDAYFILSDRTGPPGCGAGADDVWLFCSRDNQEILFLGTARVAAAPDEYANTPYEVTDLYGNTNHRYFCLIDNIHVNQNIEQLGFDVLTKEKQHVLLQGQAYVKNLPDL